MQRRARTRRARSHLARMAAHMGQELAHVLCRKIGVHGQHQRHAAQAADEAEVLLRVVAEAAVHRRIEGQRARIGRAHGVAVGGRAHDLRRADDGRRAGLVLDHHGLAQLLGHADREVARDHIGRASGCVGHDPFDGLLRGKGRLCLCHARAEQGGAEHRNELPLLHVLSPWFMFFLPPLRVGSAIGLSHRHAPAWGQRPAAMLPSLAGRPPPPKGERGEAAAQAA
ncbi:hypothetical protein D3C78_1168180 [compost metagenome]